MEGFYDFKAVITTSLGLILLSLFLAVLPPEDKSRRQTASGTLTLT